MNARELQEAVRADLNELFADRFYKTPENKMAPIKAYCQQLPQFDAQELDGFFPYAIVRLDKGGVESPRDAYKVDVMIIIGIYDDGTQEYTGEKETPKPGQEPSFVGSDGWDQRNFGYMAVMEAIELIQTHYEQEPALKNGAFYFDGPFNWALQDEDSYPYYFGVCELTFTLSAPRKKESPYV